MPHWVASPVWHCRWRFGVRPFRAVPRLQAGGGSYRHSLYQLIGNHDQDYTARTDEGSNDISWYYKSTGLDKDHQITIHKKGSIPEKPTEVVANVWNWDPKWKIEWWEDSQEQKK